MGSLSLARSVWLGGAVILGASCQVIEGIDAYETAPTAGSATTHLYVLGPIVTLCCR